MKTTKEYRKELKQIETDLENKFLTFVPQNKVDEILLIKDIFLPDELLGVNNTKDGDCLFDAAKEMEFDSRLDIYEFEIFDNEVAMGHILSIGDFEDGKIYCADYKNPDIRFFVDFEHIIGFDGKLNLLETIERFLYKDDYKY